MWMQLPMKTARLRIRSLRESDCSSFLKVMNSNDQFLYPWVRPVKTKDEFLKYYQTFNRISAEGFLLEHLENNEIVGLVSLGGILRGALQSGQLGFYLSETYSKKGFMSEALKGIIPYIFKNLRLHRIEANVQPNNRASKALIKKMGFVNEGFSQRFMYIYGAWRDHERWAICSDY